MSELFKFGPGVKWPGVAKTIEEMGELVQLLGKLVMVEGQDDKHWSGPLRPGIVEESADVAAALYFQYRHVLTPLERTQFDIRVAAKLAKFEEWHREGEELRRVEWRL